MNQQSPGKRFPTVVDLAGDEPVSVRQAIREIRKRLQPIDAPYSNRVVEHAILETAELVRDRIALNVSRRNLADRLDRITKLKKLLIKQVDHPTIRAAYTIAARNMRCDDDTPTGGQIRGPIDPTYTPARDERIIDEAKELAGQIDVINAAAIETLGLRGGGKGSLDAFAKFELPAPQLLAICVVRIYMALRNLPIKEVPTYANKGFCELLDSFWLLADKEKRDMPDWQTPVRVARYDEHQRRPDIEFPLAHAYYDACAIVDRMKERMTASYRVVFSRPKNRTI